jgi:N6-adenosine-specific RNA methylase IME4
MKMLTERPHGGFRALLCDPPWAFKNRSEAGEGRNPNQHYDCMDLADIASLPVPQMMAADSACFMWATFPMLPEALDLMKAWQFTYKSGGAWAKQSSTGAKWAFGTGYIYRSAAELLLVGTRGKPKWLSRSERNLWVAPIREHSRKPEIAAEAIVRMTPEPRLEMFARETRPGFVAWGNETGHFSPEAEQ